MKREMKKESPEYKAFIAVWEFWKKYGTPEDNAEYWDETIKAGSEKVALNPDFKDCWDLSSEMFKAVENVLDARNKSMKRYGDDKHGYEILLEKARAVEEIRAEERKELMALRKERKDEA